MTPLGPELDDEAISKFVREVARRFARTDPAAADDLAQATLLAALRAASVDVREMRPWLRTIALNTRRKQVERDTRRLDAEARYAEDSADQTRGRRQRELAGASELTGVEVSQRVARALDRLSARNRQLLALRFIDGTAPREIALHLTLPINTVRSRIQRALAALRVEMKRH